MGPTPPRFLEDHPLLALPRRLTVSLGEYRSLPQTDVALAIDSIGAVRPEQAYHVVSQGSESRLTIILANGGRHTAPTPNRSRFEDIRRRFPLQFDIAKRTDELYLQEGRNDDVWAVEALMDNRSLRCVGASLFPCAASVTQRYFPMLDADAERNRMILAADKAYAHRIRSVPLLSDEERDQLCSTTVTSSPDRATRLLDALVHRVTAQLFYQERIPALFIVGDRAERRFSHKSPDRSSHAPFTASVRRMVHRPNAYQLEQVRYGRETLDSRAMRAIAQGLNYHVLHPLAA